MAKRSWTLVRTQSHEDKKRFMYTACTAVDGLYIRCIYYMYIACTAVDGLYIRCIYYMYIALLADFFSLHDIDLRVVQLHDNYIYTYCQWRRYI